MPVSQIEPVLRESGFGPQSVALAKYMIGTRHTLRLAREAEDEES